MYTYERRTIFVSFFIFFTLVSPCISVFCGTSRTDVDKMLERAGQLNAAGDLAAAQNLYLKANSMVKAEKLSGYLDRIRQGLRKIHREKVKDRKMLERLRSEKARVEEASRKEKERLMIKQANRVYGEAYDLYRKGDYASAGKKFREVKELSSGYKSTEYYLEKISEMSGRKEKKGTDTPSPGKSENGQHKNTG